MTSILSYKNLSLCIYIGNITTIDDKLLLNYCSRFGLIISSLNNKEKFCDFNIIEYDNNEQLNKFLNIKNHEIEKIKLDIKLYKHILIHNDILNIDRKFYFGPILNDKDEKLIIEFYKKIDPILKYCLYKYDKQIYLLFEFNNRQIIKTIFEKQTIPIINEYRIFNLYKPIHPKQFVNKIISMKYKYNQIYINGLNSQINEQILIEYFDKHIPVIACHIFPDNPKRAVMEFNDKNTVRKILETSNRRLNGVNLTLTKASHHLASLLSSSNETEQSDDDDDNQVQISESKPILNPVSIRHQSSYPQNIQQSFVASAVTEPILVPSPEAAESGWSSPPRTVIPDSPAIDQLMVRMSSKPCATTNSINTNGNNQLTTINTDIKPSSNNILQFVEQFQTELEQIKDEYRLKFEKNQKNLEQEINLLINEERHTFEKLNRYFIDRQNRVEKRQKTKRKHSPTSSTD